MEEHAEYHNEYGDPATRRPRGRAGFLFFFIIVNLIISIIGGTVGFVLLSDSTTPWARTIRNVLNVSEVTIPTLQTNIRLEESSAMIDAAKKVGPAVVSISATQQIMDFFGRVSTQEVSGGSGFILTSDGLILTNKHVVQATEATYKVILSDGRILDATVKARDPFNDLAIVKVEARDLPTVEIGSSDDLQIGQYVVAIGNALGVFKNSVTQGIVSAKGRDLTAGSGESSERLTDLIQTDAAINPGNSGGPLVNLRGQVVGINTAIASTSGGSIGVGFAIAIDSVKNVIDSVRKTGEIIRPYLGVRYQTVTKALQQLRSLRVGHGALITGEDGVPGVIPDSPAAKAGIQEGDIILEVNGEQVNADNELSKRLQKYSVGDEITLKVLRGEQEISIKVVLERLAQS